MTRRLPKPALVGAAAITEADIKRWRRDGGAWIEECLVDPETGKPYVLNRSQRRFLAKALEPRPDGKLRYPELVYSAPKKSGKTAFAAMIVLYVLLVLSPPYSEAICCANDFDQAQGRTFRQIARIVQASPLLAGDATILRDRIEFAATKATIYAISSDAAGSAGSNASIVTFDELWGYVSEKSRRLWDESTPPPTRKIACRLTVSYAGFEGESQLLWELYQRGMAGKLIGDELYENGNLLMAWHTSGVAPWQDKSWLDSMLETCRPAAFLRLACNAWTSSESSFVEEPWIDACTDPNLRPVVADLKMPVWVGCDASTKKDSTALVAVTWDAETKRVVLVWHKIFVPTKANPIDFAVVEQTLIGLRQKFDVQAIFFDPFQFASTAQRLQRAGLFMREFPQTTDRLTAASQNLYDLLKGGGIALYRDPDLRLALLRAAASEGVRGWKITKTQASHRIDFVVALAQAALGAVTSGELVRHEFSMPVVLSGAPRDAWAPDWTGAWVGSEGTGLGDGDRYVGTSAWTREKLGGQ
jgi:phage terminase large subunit-like protein